MKQQQIRIIAGIWRGRKISFPNISDLRPTGDRIRETLFNWLQFHIQNACCLDLFAGSGVLSFEALSRGAKKVLALEQDPRAVQSLHENAAILQTKALEIHALDSLKWLSSPNIQEISFDIVFLDPPFAKKLLPDCFSLLEKGQWLKNEAWVYFESDEPLDFTLSENWQKIQEKKAGQVYYGLVHYSAPSRHREKDEPSQC